MIVGVADTCNDNDCKCKKSGDPCPLSKSPGCCTHNASLTGDGTTLVDLEFNTAKTFWNTNNPDGVQQVEWRVVE